MSVPPQKLLYGQKRKLPHPTKKSPQTPYDVWGESISAVPPDLLLLVQNLCLTRRHGAPTGEILPVQIAARKCYSYKFTLRSSHYPSLTGNDNLYYFSSSSLLSIWAKKPQLAYNYRGFCAKCQWIHAYYSWLFFTLVLANCTTIVFCMSEGTYMTYTQTRRLQAILLRRL